MNPPVPSGVEAKAFAITLEPEGVSCSHSQPTVAAMTAAGDGGVAFFG